MDFWLNRGRLMEDRAGVMDFWLQRGRLMEECQKQGETMDPHTKLNLSLHSIKAPKSLTSVHHDKPGKYYVIFSGNAIKTTVTCRDSTASEWAQRMMEKYNSTAMEVGLAAVCIPQPDTSGIVATLQLCIENYCLILQMTHMDKIPQSIRQFLKNPNFTFVGVELVDNMNRFLESCGLECPLYTDLGMQAAACYLDFYVFSKPKPGLPELAGVLFGWWLENPKQSVLKSDWKALRLSEAQVEYLCIRAFVNFKIGQRLQSSISSRLEKTKFFT